MRYIPKTIHLIWFGGNQYNLIVKKCIDSWYKYCPDYDIKLWNEESFDINLNIYAKEAYETKKWAFVSDYVRLYVLYNYGGVYIDSDVMVLKNFDCLLEDEHVVTGYSSSLWIPAGFMAAEKSNEWIKALLDYYTNRHFQLSRDSFDMKVNNAIITEISMKKFGFKIGDMSIKYGNVKLYPRRFFHPYKKEVFEFNEENIKKFNKFFNINEKDTYCIHYSMGSWVENHNTPYYQLKHLIRKILPQYIIEWLECIYYKIHIWQGK